MTARKKTTRKSRTAKASKAAKAKRGRTGKTDWLSLVTPAIVIQKLGGIHPGKSRTSREEARMLIASAAVRARNLCMTWDAELKEIIHEGREVRDSIGHGILLLCCAHYAENIQDNSSKRYFADAVQILRAAVEQSTQGGIGARKPGCRQHVVLRCAGQIARSLRASMRDPKKLPLYRQKLLQCSNPSDRASDEELETALRMLSQSIPSLPGGRQEDPV